MANQQQVGRTVRYILRNATTGLFCFAYLSCSGRTGFDQVCEESNAGVEICDEIDNDCDGEVDEGLICVVLPATCVADEDCADPCRSGNRCVESVCVRGPVDKDSDADSFLDAACEGGNDCNDDPLSNGAVCHPQAEELCDGLDNDCNVGTADGADDPSVGLDCDGTDSDACAEGIIYCAAGGALECNDVTGDSIEGPFGDMTCSDTTDNDCDTLEDEADPDCQAVEMDLRQGATPIADGTGTYDYGELVPGVSSGPLTFTVENDGNLSLELTGVPKVSKSGIHPGDFTIDEAGLAGTISPSSSSTFTITFMPGASGTRSATISIANNDSDEDPYTFTVTGTGLWGQKIFDGNGDHDQAMDVTTDNAGNVYVCGYGTNLVTGSSAKDFWIKKFQPDGVEITTGWDKRIDGNGADDYSEGIDIDESDNVIVAGSGNDIVNGTSGLDAWAIKYDDTGNLSWERKIDKSVTDEFHAVLIDASGDAYLAGNSEGLGGTDYDWWAVKLYGSDGQDDILWGEQSFDAGYGNEFALSMAFDWNGDILVFGRADYGDSPLNEYDWQLKKYRTDGSEDGSWSLTYNTGNGPGSWDYGFGVAVDTDNSWVYLVGSDQELATGADFYIRKLDSSATIVWEHRFDGGDSFNDYAVDVALDSFGNIYMAGYGYHLVGPTTENDLWIKKFSPAGVEDTVNWDKRIDFENGTDELQGIHIDDNNNVFVVGFATISGNQDWFITRYDVDGKQR